MQRYLLWCAFTGSSLEIKIEADSNDAVEIKTEADSNNITEHPPRDMPRRPAVMFGLYHAITFCTFISLHVTYMVLICIC